MARRRLVVAATSGVVAGSATLAAASALISLGHRWSVVDVGVVALLVLFLLNPLDADYISPDAPDHELRNHVRLSVTFRRKCQPRRTSINPISAAQSVYPATVLALTP